VCEVRIENLDFHKETPVESGHSNRTLCLLVGGIALTLVASSSAILATRHLLSQHLRR